MGEAFSIQGFSGQMQMMCVIDGGDIFQVDYFGGRKPIGKTAQAYAELEETTKQYYGKLVELGVIVPPKSQEEIMAEMQRSMAEMASVIAGLKDQIEGGRNNEHPTDCRDVAKDISISQSDRSDRKGAAANPRRS